MCIEKWRTIEYLVHYNAMCLKMEADALVSCDLFNVQYDVVILSVCIRSSTVTNLSHACSHSKVVMRSFTLVWKHNETGNTIVIFTQIPRAQSKMTV